MILFGWMFPLLLVGIWYVINLLEDVSCTHKSAWQLYIYTYPIYALLLANLIMLICILRVLFIKLRNSNDQRQQQLRMRHRRNLDAADRNREDDDKNGSRSEDQQRSSSPDDWKSEHFTLRYSFVIFLFRPYLNSPADVMLGRSIWKRLSRNCRTCTCLDNVYWQLFPCLDPKPHSHAKPHAQLCRFDDIKKTISLFPVLVTSMLYLTLKMWEFFSGPRIYFLPLKPSWMLITTRRSTTS